MTGRYRSEDDPPEQPIATQPLSWSDVVDKDLTFIIPDGLLIHLETWISSAGGREVSGVGIMEKDPEAKTFTLRKCWLMAAGSVAYTEIPGARMVKLIEEGVRPDQLKVWWHRHPVGNGIPGPHNWSGTDNNTIREEPFGIDPSMVKWLVSIVRTPRGWVGRYDSHVLKQTVHMSVKTKVSEKQYGAAADLIDRHIQAELQATMVVNQSVPTVTLPRRPGHQYFPPSESSDDSKVVDSRGQVLNSLGLKKGLDGFRPRHEANADLAPIEGGVENMLKIVGWSRKTYLAVMADMSYERPEFVAFDHQVTLAAMHKLNLLTQDQLNQVLYYIQERVDANDPQYITLIANWDLADL